MKNDYWIIRIGSSVDITDFVFIMTTKERKLLNKIKFNAVKLEEIGCLPTCLFNEIAKTSVTSSQDRVKILMALSQQFLRSKGYYNLKYPFVVKDVEDCRKLCKGLLY